MNESQQIQSTLPSILRGAAGQDRQNQMERMDTPKRRGRGCFLWLSRMMVLFLGLMLTGVIYESVAEATDMRAYPPPGQMVDVGGYRLHLNCMGTGSPTVVIDAGWGDWSATWSWVLTYLPQAGSPAIDGGECVAGLTTDQRGAARLVGTACEIGAVEQSAGHTTSSCPSLKSRNQPERIQTCRQPKL